MTKLLSIKLSTTPAPQAWGEDNQLSVAPEGFTIHIGDLSLQDSLSVIQSTARKIQGMGVNQLAIEGDWDIEQQWSLYQGLVTAKGGQSVAWLAQDAKELDARKKTFDWTREMTNLPPADMYPLELANQAVKFIKELAGDAVTHSLVIGDDLQEAGWIGIHSVGRASIHPPVLLSLDYNPTGDESAPIEYALVGKGITFDSGGYSIKSSEGMLTMKCDMGGAATVTGALGLAILRGLNKRVRLILCCAENMIAGNAYRLGDVITYKNGLTVEVVNTDAEGRLVLADILTYVQNEYSPRCIVDLATLTGAIVATLGHEMAGLFTNSTMWGDAIMDAGDEGGEGFFRMPMGKNWAKMIESEIADFQNIGGPYGGSTTAAEFLYKFVDKKTAWAHLDIAGMCWSKSGNATTPKGAVGFGVKTLFNIVDNTDSYQWFAVEEKMSY